MLLRSKMCNRCTSEIYAIFYFNFFDELENLRKRLQIFKLFNMSHRQLVLNNFSYHKQLAFLANLWRERYLKPIAAKVETLHLRMTKLSESARRKTKSYGKARCYRRRTATGACNNNKDEQPRMSRL